MNRGKICFTVRKNPGSRIVKKCVELEVWEQMRGPLPPSNFKSDACTLWFDNPFGVRVWVACKIHDWHYSKSGPEISRTRADAKFAANVYKIATIDGRNFMVASFLAAKYTAAVVWAGRPFFKRAKAKLLELTEGKDGVREKE
jgi:hypothetical protein